MEEKYPENVLTDAFLTILIVMVGIVLWMLYGISTELRTHTSTRSTASVSVPQEQQPAVPQKTSSVAVLPPIEFTVARGDALSCLAPYNWREVAKRNGIKNPNLIFPGQKLQIPPGTQLHGSCKPTKTSMAVHYCRIGADPVNPNRQLSALEREYRFNSDILVTMGSGSGKSVTCILKKDEAIVIDQNNRAQWVRRCGNPILNQIVVPQEEPVTVTPKTAPETKEEVPVRAIKKEKAGLIILKTFEGKPEDETKSQHSEQKEK